MAYSNTTGLPSPSSVTRPFIDPAWFTEASRDRGHAVHAACAAHLAGGYALIDRQYRGYFDSFKRWAVEEKPEAEIIEERLICKPYGFCGQPDFVGRIRSRAGRGVVDFKTGAALGKAWPLQIAAYRKLAEPTMWGCSVRLREDGGYPLVTFHEDFERDFNLFLSALNLYRHFNG